MSETLPVPQPEGLQFNPEDYTLEEILKPKNCALVVVDMQNDFCDPSGFFATKLKHDVTQMQSIVPNVQRMIDAAHSANVPVIFTQGSEDVRFRKPGPDARRAVKWDEHDGDGSVNSERGTHGWEFYGVKPAEGDVIVEKHKWSAFDGKDENGKSFKQIIDEKGVKTLVVVGVVAETCIESTLHSAYDNDYCVVVPKNSVGSDQPEQLKQRMEYWEGGHLGDALDETKIEELWTIPAV